MKKNKELAPEEGKIFVYRDKDDAVCYGRIGEATFAQACSRGILNGRQFTEKVADVISRVGASMDFFERHGVDPTELKSSDPRIGDHGTLQREIIFKPYSEVDHK